MIFGSLWPPMKYASASVGDAVLGAEDNPATRPPSSKGRPGETLTYHQLIHGAERVGAGL
jgi:hypothetical protein